MKPTAPSARTGPRKSLLLIGLISICLIAAAIGVRELTSPEHAVAKTIGAVRAADTEGLTLSQDDQNRIASFFPSAEDTKVSIHNAVRSEDQAQVAAFFEIIRYDQNQQVKETQSGSLIFTLEKAGWFRWQITRIEQHGHMSAPSQSD